VREDATELCAATPCDVTFKGDGADPVKAHKLVVTRSGYRPETKTVKLGDPPLQVKLVRAPAWTRPVTAPKPADPKPADPPTPNGFKELPY
jgi:serine/threonine-protein kinase